VSPLINLSKHAEKFPGGKIDSSTLPQRGPVEVRELTKSINRMQNRILDMINARTHLLASVSHDLKTIITRMRLRSQFITDDELRVKMEKDIQFMDIMVKNNLQYLKYEGEKSEHSPIDLDSVIQTVTDEFIDLGFKVSYHGGNHEQINGSITEMLRVFTNLIDNATRYASHINIYLSQAPNHIIQIDIIDDGPGIAEELKPIIFEPFVRGETGRTMDADKGFGLGLSIVRELLKSHQGAIEFINREPNGLIARVTLPQAMHKFNF
ncbi:MAG: ATP-binding protein, partial [Methylocystis sp.]